MTAYTGSWHLVASADTESEIDFVEPTFDAEFAWLSVSASDLLAVAHKTSGLTLEITDEKVFMQQICGDPAVMWYDVEGVLGKTVTPFGGKCFSPRSDGYLYLISDDRPKWATPRDAAKLQFFRYDDSDTVICDFVEIQQDSLIRTVNVLTDGQYLSHILMKFTRQ